jgi:hypothetical protein
MDFSRYPLNCFEDSVEIQYGRLQPNDAGQFQFIIILIHNKSSLHKVINGIFHVSHTPRGNAVA